MPPAPQYRLRLRDHLLKNDRSAGTVLNEPYAFPGDDRQNVKILSLPRLHIRLSQAATFRLDLSFSICPFVSELVLHDANREFLRPGKTAS